ncbi:hypothetical protein LCGC14_1112730, partial [marine sediment metagenome]
RMVVTTRGAVLITASPSAFAVNPADIPADVFAAATRDVFIIAPGQSVYVFSVIPAGFNGISAAISDMLE